MKRFLILAAVVVAALFSAAGCSHHSYGAAAVDREAQRQAGDFQDSLEYVAALRAIEEREFVFEANMLLFRSGGTARVFSNLNFVSLKGDHATIQVAPYDAGGPNGVGGVTVEGRVTNMEVKTDRRGNTDVTMNVMGRAVFATVNMTLPKGSSNASVTVIPNLNSNRLTLYGSVVPAGKSRVFKGMSL